MVRVRNIHGEIHGITVATPIYDGQLRVEFVDSMQRLQRACDRLGVRLTWLRVTNTPVERARDALASLFLRSRENVLLFIDADQGFPVRAAFDAVRLAQRLDMVACAVPDRSTNWSSVHQAAQRIPFHYANRLLSKVSSGARAITTLHKGQEIPLDEPFELSQAGTGFLAIHRRVFDRIAAAAPTESFYEVEPGYRMPTFFAPIIASNTLIGEDLSFCRRWRQVGGRIWGIIWHDIVHVGTFDYRSDAHLHAALGIPIGQMDRIEL